MATQKILPTTITVDSFLNTIGDEKIKADCKEIAGIMQAVTTEKPTMWGPAIIGFGSYHYKYESGHEGESCIIGFSPRKQNITLYVGAGSEALAPYLEKLGKYKVKGGCLHINKLVDVDKTVLKELISTAYETQKIKGSC
ncbi:hypothetical protein BH10BAC3_BH10BAC3_02570 [soil metagenome]